jgi:hypothetical protein
MSENPYGGHSPGRYGQAPQSGPGYHSEAPSGAGGYAFGPFAPGAEQSSGPYPGQSAQPPAGYPTGYSGQPPAGPKSPRSRRGLIILGAALLALIILGVGTAAVLINVRQARTPQGGATNDPASTASATMAGPSDTVLGYLTALSSGDADSALSYGATKPAESSMLTDKVLTAASKREPLTSIDVPAVEGESPASVRASYKIGETPVTETFTVIKQGEEWKLERVAADVELGLIRSGSVPLLINGTKVSKSAVSLFPGSYTFSTGLDYVDYGAKSTILIKTPSAFPDTTELALRVNGKGKSAAVTAARKSYAKCLKSDDPAPSKCPNRWTSSAAKWREGTVDWEQRGSDPFKKAKVITSGVQAQVHIPLRVELSGTCTQGGRTGRCLGATITGTSIAMTSLNTNSPKIRWL